MKKLKVHSIIGLVLVMVFALAINLLVPFLGLAHAGVSMAIGTVVPGGTVTQESIVGADEATEYIDMKDVQRKVELYKPYQTPILTLMSDQSKGTCESWEHKYFAVDSRGLHTTVVSASAIVQGTTTLTLDDSSIFTRNNTIFFPAITGATKVLGGRTLVGIVTSVGTGTVTVKLINPAVGGSNLVYGDFSSVECYRGGSAHNEKTASTGAWGVLPDYDYNYVQYFMEQIEVTDYQEVMKKQIDWNFADMKRMAIDDFKLQRERTFLNGVRTDTSIVVDGASQRIYTCGGFLQDTGIPVTPNINLASLDGKGVNSFTKSTFTGNNGSKKRFLLGGADFVEALQNVYVDNKWILAKETEQILGLEFVKIVSMFGTFDVMYYEQLDLLGKAKSAIIIDKANISTSDLAGIGSFNVRKIDLRSSGISKVDAAAIEQYSTMLVKNKVTHRILEGV